MKGIKEGEDEWRKGKEKGTLFAVDKTSTVRSCNNLSSNLPQ